MSYYYNMYSDKEFNEMLNKLDSDLKPYFGIHNPEHIDAFLKSIINKEKEDTK